MVQKRGKKRRRSAAIQQRASSCPARRVHVGSSALPAAFLDETIAVWQPHTTRPLNREDAREIIHNITGFFSILMEWEQAERRAADQSGGLSAPDNETKEAPDVAALSPRSGRAGRHQRP